MLATLNIRDETMFGFGEADRFFALKFPTDRVTVRQLIETRIREEVEKYNSAHPEVFNMLVQPSLTERVLNGYKFKEKKKINWREQYEKAIEAFDRNNFIVLADEIQVEDLDQIIEISPETSVAFLKLVPLVGG